MAKLHYLVGDATDPIETDSPRIIAHVANDSGGWGRGFVVALSARDKRPEELYREMIRKDRIPLGETWVASFDPSGKGGYENVFVANMVAQHGYITPETPVPLDYKALWDCLLFVGDEACDMGATVHMPRIGCGLGGGDWSRVEPMIKQTIVDLYGVDVYVYDLPK